MSHERAWRVVSTVTNLMLAALPSSPSLVFVFAASHRPAHHARLRPGDDGPDDRADADHGPEPDLAGSRGGRDERAQHRGPVRGGGDRADRLQPRDHRRRARARARRSGSSGWPSASSLASLGHVARPGPPLRQLGFRYTPRIDLLGRRGAASARAHGSRGRSASAPARSRSSSRRRWRRRSGSGRSPRSTIAFTLLQIPIGVIGVPLGVVAVAVAVARCRHRRR